VFAVFDQQDSGCVSYGVRIGDERLFVKTPTTPAAVLSLRSAVRFHAAVRHPAINPVLQVVPFDVGPVLVMPWLDAALLRGPGGWSRFRALPVRSVEAAVESLLSAHRAVAAAGFVEVDLYAGSLMYDFDRHALQLIDLDDYRPGPFTAEERLPGSTRFMAPEQWGGGTTIDERSTVFVLGRAIRLMLDARDDESAWRGTDEQLAVVRRATAPGPDDRYPTVAALQEAWALSPSTPR
jgi:serine/threonine-protein kinase